MKDIKDVKGVSGAAKNLPHYKASTHLAHSSGSIKPIDKSDMIKSGNYGSSSEQIRNVYEKLRAMAEEYRSFFKNEQDFEKAFADVSQDDEDFIRDLVEFLTIYNSSVDTLREFDKYFETNHLSAVNSITLKYEDDLKNIFIFIEPDGRLRFIIKKMARHYHEKREDFEFMIKPDGLGRQLLDKFRSVKSIIIDTSDDKMHSDEIHGLIIDKKC